MNDPSLQTFISLDDSDADLRGGYHADGPQDAFRDGVHDESRTDLERTAALLAAEARIGSSSTVLEVGSGCGNLLVHLAQRFGCRGEGVFTSEEYVRLAQESIRHQRHRIGIDFRQASVMRLPYERGTFTHVVSRDALYGMADKSRGHAEIHRVLKPDGVFACTDFFQPRKEISERTRELIYGQLGWGGGRSLVEHQSELEEAGFEVILARNLNSRLKEMFQDNAEAVRERAERTRDTDARAMMLDFSSSCDEIRTAIDRGELGWATFVGRKREGAGQTAL